ncbi:MAPEG family protein [Uruburuella testudinis]|uniref:MAPEG family protein n=1 Tax=Uruburuella testudinis TaxID=1282863 RepID=A0ABY4DR52_9NEIS|nr:MAPEG family protein [Uruburuella testudinis]UOO81526.1 MAPEG family protein [Uruburuella testudinis]
MTIAYWCVFAAMFIPWICAAYAKKAGGFQWHDNHHPRGFLAHAQGRAERADAAQKNGYEIFPPFAAAVIIAHATGNAGQAGVNFWALCFVFSRLAYSYCYIKDMPAIRSALWGMGLICIMALFGLAC